MLRRTTLCAIIVLFFAGCAPSLKELKPALESGDAGKIWFASPGGLAFNAAGTELLPSDPLALSGDLQVPPGAGPFPAVILAHGCGGISNIDRAWADVLSQWGYAVFITDSLSPRNLTEVCTDYRRLSWIQRIPDVYGALNIVATHPRIDANKIVLMGFSQGGTVAIGAATAWAKDTFASAGGPTFSLFITIYPFCNFHYPEWDQISAPLRIHSGALDDWTPAAPCARLVDRLQASKQDAAITIYPGAHHAFDMVGRSHLYLPNVLNAADCGLVLPGMLQPVPPREALAECFKKGATIAWDQNASEKARATVKAQLTELLAR